jgi:hypothetical protein
VQLSALRAPLAVPPCRAEQLLAPDAKHVRLRALPRLTRTAALLVVPSALELGTTLFTNFCPLEYSHSTTFTTAAPRVKDECGMTSHPAERGFVFEDPR